MDYFTKRKILHLFFPNRCPICREFIGANDLFCKDCENLFEVYDGNDGVKGSDGFTSVFYYEKNIAKAVFLMKDGVCGNADFALGMSLAERLKKDDKTDFDTIIPVPMYRSSRRKRGYNQAELLAVHVSRELKVPYDFKSVRKVRRTANQKKLNRAMRRINLKDAFAVERQEAVKGKKILLIDDVCTTGATLSEISLLLKRNGAESVYSASCCKTKDPRKKVNSD